LTSVVKTVNFGVPLKNDPEDIVKFGPLVGKRRLAV